MKEVAELVLAKLSREEVEDVCFDALIDSYSFADIDGAKVSNLITFENCNDVARSICLANDEIAKGLMEELKYWYRGDK